MGGRCKKQFDGLMEPVEELCEEVETVRGFSYLGDRVNANGGCKAAPTARARVKLKECEELLNSKRFSLKMKRMVSRSSIRSAMLYGSSYSFTNSFQLLDGFSRRKQKYKQPDERNYFLPYLLQHPLTNCRRKLQTVIQFRLRNIRNGIINLILSTEVINLYETKS